MAPSPASDAPSEGALEGVSVSALDAATRRQHSIPGEVAKGVVITAIEPGSPALAAGLRTGDVIVEVNRSPVESVAAFTKAYAASRDPVVLLVQRGGATMYMVIRH